jgi:parallel beta-helix repeat protein
MDCWPDAKLATGANGGGITGDEFSNPVILNNIIYRCYHGIGYKNGSMPLIANNLVLDCNVGVTFYKDECSMPPPRPVLYNNIIWNNRNHETGAPQNVVLNGAWFAEYCQDLEDQAEIDMRHSIVEGGWPGEGNLDLDPLIRDAPGGDFSLAAGSPALDSGFGGPFTVEEADPEMIAELLRHDQAGNLREDLPCVDNAGAGAVLYYDRGPLEGAATLCLSANQSPFLRGDGNDDGVLDMSDALTILSFLFSARIADCEDALDADDNGHVEISDALFMLIYVFRDGDPPPAPFPAAGEDPSEDGLGCDR